jgi:flagellar biosynthesis/type III secretory pathway M-ring protein FliF/YscJ
VQFSEVSTGGLSRSTEKSALVAVQAIGNASLDAEHVQAIRNTVAAAIGVQQQNVTVTDLNARHAYVGTSAAAAGNDSNYLTDKAQFEKQWQDKIYRRLAIYPGIVVGVNVELDADAHRFNKTVTAYRAALAPTRVTASIDVPASYFLDVWRTRNAESQSNHGDAPSRAELHSIEAEVKANIEAAVVGMLPPWPAGAEPYRRVTITAYQDLPAPLEQGPSWARGASRWMAANWQLLGMAMLGAISLLLLPSVIRAAKSPPAKASTPSTDAAATGNDESPKEPPAATSKEPQHHVETSDQTLHEELQKRVRQDPQAAAKVLRHWIGDAA